MQGQTDLAEGTRNAPEAGGSGTISAFAHPIAFNVIPQIGSAKYEGYTSEEMKMVYETQKILEDDSIQVCPTCVRVPVSNCHSESILVETEKPISAAAGPRTVCGDTRNYVVDDLEAGHYPMPSNSDDLDEVFVGRIRKDISCDNGLAFWCVSDNFEKARRPTRFKLPNCWCRASTHHAAHQANDRLRWHRLRRLAGATQRGFGPGRTWKTAWTANHTGKNSASPPVVGPTQACMPGPRSAALKTESDFPIGRIPFALTSQKRRLTSPF